MNFATNTYRTITGVKEVVEIPKKKYHQWLVYQDNKPAYFVDFYDLAKESNAMMNSLVLCSDNTLEYVLKIISQRNNINLSLPKISRIGLKRRINSKKTELDLQPIPEKWLAYSL
ncbi:hypothetical protein SHK09_02290 [Polaribacter sp. PL03]|uniref:hypothetical protein n=1 Tax=Polaribacter sp. PL03 TaxID=3088353 RepID=UPI0029D30858|nr:hypothetical protein [Polaribacter sp. PL03]MDX6745608.1 hypothetical protein [Polaribacter sp. PL03]